MFYTHLAHTAPSAPPTSVSVSEVTSSSITVQWGPVDCIHRNGDITGYSVQYREVGSGIVQTISVSVVSGDSATEIIISNLDPSTIYTIEVAAVNSAGTGPYSYPLIAEVLESEDHDLLHHTTLLLVFRVQTLYQVHHQTLIHQPSLEE